MELTPKKQETLNGLIKERETLLTELQKKLIEVHSLSRIARETKSQTDFDAYVTASAEYESKYTQLVKVEERIRTLKHCKVGSYD